MFEVISVADPGFAGRQTPVRWTHEPHRASRGGLSGLDASWRTLLTVREETRRRSKKVGERDRSEVWWHGNGGQRAQQRRHRAKVAAQVALAEPVMVTAGAGGVGVVPGMLMGGMLMFGMVCSAHRVMIHFQHCRCHAALTARKRRRTQHRSRDRTPNREQDGKQHQEPNTNGFHSGSDWHSRRSRPPMKSRSRVQPTRTVEVPTGARSRARHSPATLLALTRERLSD